MIWAFHCSMTITDTRKKRKMEQDHLNSYGTED